MRHFGWALIGIITYSVLSLVTLYFNPSLRGHGPVGAGLGLFFIYLVTAAGTVGAIVGGASSLITKKGNLRNMKITIALVLFFVPILVFLLILY